MDETILEEVLRETAKECEGGGRARKKRRMRRDYRGGGKLRKNDRKHGNME